jgi:predicted acetylornithine/succinylornithine family transaminase
MEGRGLSVLTKEGTKSSYLVNTYNQYPVEFIRGDGAYLYDSAGKTYIDFLCGIAVTGFGHNNQEINSAAVEQMNKFWHVSNLFESTPQSKLAEKLTRISGLDKVFFCNTGTEAVEGAIKFARKYSEGKYEIITALNGFHGRTMGSLSATAQKKLQEGYSPLLDGFKHVPYDNIEAVENAITDKTVAVLIESIQGEGGINVPSKNYLTDLRLLCNDKNLLLIIDEIQTGMGRTGKYFAYQHENILPDMITIAKGIANGIPLGAIVCSEKIAEKITPGSHGSTFGGNPVAVAAANKVIDLLDENMLGNISSLGKKLFDALHGLHLDQIKDIRGKGLIIGVEFQENISAKEIAKKMLLEEKFLLGTAKDSVVRVIPPFIITEKEIMKFLISFKKVVSSF